MFENLKMNMIGVFDILFRPQKVAERVREINKTMDETTGITLVGASTLSELKKEVKKYPTDDKLNERVLKAGIVPSTKEELTFLIKFKKEIIEMPEQICKECGRKYKISCNHTENK